MSVLKLMRENLTPEEYTKFMDAIGDDFDWDLVPRSRLNKVIKQRNEARDALGNKSQLPNTPLQDDPDDDPDDDEGAGAGGGAGATKPPAGKPSAGTDVAALQAQHLKELNDLKIRYSAIEKLRAAGARDPELILKAGLLNLEDAKLAEDGASVAWPDGDKDPFELLKKDEARAYLFGDSEGSSVPGGTGKLGGSGGSGGDDALDKALDAAMGMDSAVSQVNPPA